MDLSSRREETEAPEHWEAAELSPGVRLAGWAVALVGGVGGVLLMAQTEGLWEGVGVAAALAGIGAAFVVVRLRRFETVVGARWLEAGAGPFTRRVGRHGLGELSVRPATAWRRLYADREVVTEVVHSGEKLVFPSMEPEELLRALE